MTKMSKSYEIIHRLILEKGIHYVISHHEKALKNMLFG